MSEYFRKADPSRLVHYESICWDRVNEASGKMVLVAMPDERRYDGTSDMESQMYTKVAQIKEFLSKYREKNHLFAVNILIPWVTVMVVCINTLI